jgi:hypothetical protein
MAEIKFVLDTTPMANTVETARGHINGVTVAVTAMEAAVIGAERNASKKICENVDNGFFMLVKSQISQKAVAAYTEMTSKQITMLQLAKALDKVKRQMESDCNMITKRYAKLFQSLNKALESRVKELDRPAMHLAEIKKTIVFDKLKDDIPLLFCISDEALPFAQTALSCKLKQKTRETIRLLSASANENSSYNETVESILVINENDFSGDSDFQYLPAIFCATDSLLNQSNSLENVYTAQADMLLNTVPIISEISRVHNDMSWGILDKEEKDAIRQEFLKLCENEINDERLLKEIIRLFDDSSWEVLHS